MLIATLLASFAPVADLRTGESVPFPEHGLTIVLPELESSMRQENPLKSCLGDWMGVWKGSDLRIRFHVLPISEYDFVEPEDVVETWRAVICDPKERGQEDKPFDFAFGSIRSVSGPVGCTPILAVLQAAAAKKDDPAAKGLLLLAGGMSVENGWSIRVDAWPAPDAEETAGLVAWLEKCATYSGKVRDPKWTDAEALEFWKRYAPESTFKKFEKPTRTEHFIVLTNSPSPGPYVKKLESKYAAIRKVLPFEELKGRKLLPVLLFRTDDDFQAFYRREFKMEVKEDVEEGSVVFGDVYATSLDNDDDYEDLIDLMKFVLINRQRAWGRCKWFQQGLREYVATKPNERLEGLRAVKRGKFTPLAKLLENEAWKDQSRKLDTKGASDEASYWEQSALWMEFLHAGPWPKDAFPRFVEKMGSLCDHDTAEVVAAIESVYGVDLMTLEKKWIEYFKKR